MNNYLLHQTGKALIAFLFAFLGICSQSSAQLLPVDQPEQDACNALVLCGNSFTTPYSYQGNGLVNDLTSTPCSGGEDNSVWFKLTVNTAGTIVFTIAPISVNDDYDFAVLDITNTACDSLSSSNVIRCNFNNNYPGSNVNGVIGLNSTSTLQYVMAGTFGSSFLQEITANAGDVYLIMINNFGNYVTGGVSKGFTIDFSGSTATFNQSPVAHLDSIYPKCDYHDSLTLQLTENVLCSSIDSDGSDFYLTPLGTVQSARGIGCSGAAGYTNKIAVVFGSSLPDGDYYLHAKVGNDSNTLLNLCDEPLPLPDSLHFHVGHDPIPLTGLDSPACQDLTLHLSAPVSCGTIAANGSDFYVTGPSSVTVNGASGVGCSAGYTQTVNIHIAQPIAVDGIYTLHVKNGTDANTMGDSCGRIVSVGSALSFFINSYNGQLTAHPDTNMCPGFVQLSVTNNGAAPAGGFQYTWTSTTNISNPNMANPSVLIDSGYHQFLVTTIDKNGCYLRDSVVVHGYEPPVANFNFRVAPGCSGDTVFFHNESANATEYLWELGEANLTDTNVNTHHVYLNAGTYPVTLVATNSHCVDSMIHIVSLGHPMHAGFTVSKDTICQGTPIQFTNTSSITADNGSGPGYQWSFGNGSSSNVKNPTYTYTRTGVYTTRLIVNDSIPCYDTVTKLIYVDSVSGLSVSVSDTPICKGDAVTFTAVYSGEGMVYSRWNFGDGPDTVMNVNPVHHAYAEAGVYTVSINNHYRVCPDTGTMFKVRVNDIPVINIGSDTSLCLDGDPIKISDKINTGNPNARWLWNTGDTTSSIDIVHPGHYWARVTIDNCSATDDIMVTKDCYMDIPNSFTPNGDGIDDYFFPRQKLAEGITAFSMSIYNRWGQQIFETESPDGRGWDGRFNGKDQPVGVYIYLINVAYKNGRTESYKGNVTLIR